MKRKKTPVLAITALVFSAVGLVVMSKQFAFYSKDRDSQLQEMSENYQKEMEAKKANSKPQPINVNAGKETKAMKERLAAINKARPQVPGEEMPTEPSVLIPEQKVYKPIRNEAATSSQWYK